MAKPKFIFAVGRRKQAVARIRLFKKRGDILVNDKPIEKYFPGLVAKNLYLQPFKTFDLLDKYSATIKVYGSGPKGQLGAVIHGLSRALVKLDEKNRPILKKLGLLTRDPRKKERRKAGTGGKARRQKQSPKR